MKASEKNWELARRFWARGIEVVDRDDAQVLRRIEKRLHRWHELESGVCVANGWGVAIVERDETTGKPRIVKHWNDGMATFHATPDYEAGALRRLKALCDSLGLHYYVQGDPRGCALYVSNEPLTDQNYSNGIPCCM